MLKQWFEIKHKNTDNFLAILFCEKVRPCQDFEFIFQYFKINFISKQSLLYKLSKYIIIFWQKLLLNE
jgi:hypothetical protein